MSHAIDAATLDALRDFPGRLEAHLAAIPPRHVAWIPDDWTGIPSECFSAVEQVWHVLDIEIEGYQARIARTLCEDTPLLPSIDSETLAVERDYAGRDASDALAGFRAARTRTLAMIDGLDPGRLERPAMFEGYGPTTLRGLVHVLCSHDQQHLAGLQWLAGRIASLPR